MLGATGTLAAACGGGGAGKGSAPSLPKGVKFGQLSKTWKGTTLNASLVAEARSDGLQKFVDEFTKQTGIKVNLNIYPYPTLEEKQATALTQRTGNIDIVLTDLVWMGQYVEAGWLTSVDKFIQHTDKSILDINDFAPTFINQQCKWKGKLYGLPFISAVFNMYYRKDIFSKHNLRPPDTWAELKDTARLIQHKESGNGIAGLTWMAKRGVQLVCTHLNVLGSNGGYYYDDSYKPTMTSQPAVHSVEYLKSLLPYCNDGILSQDYDEAATTFQQGRAAIDLQWNNAAPLFAGKDSKVASTVAITQVPGVREGGTVKRTPTLGGWNMGIVADSENKEAAWEFIVWATSKKMEHKLAGYETGSRISVFRDPQLRKRYIEYEATLKALKQAMGRPRIKGWPEMSDDLAAALSNVITGRKSPQAAMSQVNSEFERVLHRNGYGS